MPINFDKHTLPNGLTIVSETNPDAHTSAVGFFVKTGTRDEERGLMGVSHFLEHMMFKGTPRRTGEDVNREFDEIGANYNAYTSHEATVYYAQVLPEFLFRAVDLLGDMLRPALREADFEMERNVILEEIGMYEDKPHWRLQDTLLEEYFGEHPMGYRVLGTSDSIKALTCGQMRGYFEQRYSPDNITVAAAGKLEFGRLVEEVDRLAGAWRATGATRVYVDPAAAYKDRTLCDVKLNRHYISVMCPGPTAQDERRYAARILADVLGDAEGSRLYWALVDPGLADEADFSFFPSDRVGSFFAFASCDPDRAAQVKGVLLETIDRYADRIDPAEIERAKNKLATEATLQGESPGGRMRNLGTQWSYLGEYLPLEAELERLMKVMPEDVRRLIRDFPFTPKTVVSLGPKS